MKHQHPIKILKLTTKNFWLLLIPLLRGLIALRGDIYTWVQGAWVDILVIVFIGLSAYLRWYCTWYDVSASKINLKTGVFFKSSFSIPFSSICVISAERKVFFRPLHAVNLYLETDSRLRQTADMQITISLKDYKMFFRTISICEKSSGYKASYYPSKINLIIFSFLFSSTLSGVVFIATLLIQSSNIIGNSLEERIMTAVSDVSRTLATGLPPFAIGISLLIVIGWIFSFISNLLRHLDFRISRTNKMINIHTGFFTKRHYYINSDKINYADLHQNLLTKFFSIMSVHVNCSGYGNAKNEIPVFVPITTRKQIYSSLQLLLPDVSVISGGVRPRWNYFFRFIWLPFFVMITIPAVAYIFYIVFPLWYSMILFTAVMSEIPIIWLLIAKFVDFLTTRISYSDKSLCFKYSFAYSFHTVLIPKDKIAKIVIKQSIFQVLSKSCDVKIYSTNQYTKRHKIICLPLNDVLNLLIKSNICYTKIDFFNKIN